MNKIIALKNFILAIAGLCTVRLSGAWKNGKARETVTLSGTITAPLWKEAKECAMNEDCGVQVTLEKGASAEKIQKVREQFTLLASAYGQGVGEEVWNERVQFKFTRAVITVDESVLDV